MTVPDPRSLCLLVPGHLEIDPVAASELRRVLADELGAVLNLQPSSWPWGGPLPLYVGDWDGALVGDARALLAPLIDAVAYSLDWAELDAS